MFNSSDEVLNAIERKYGADVSSGLYYSTLNLCPVNLIFDRKIQDWIERYQFCKQFNVKPFNVSSYEELPCTWVDFCKIMNNELIECEKESIKRNKNG